MAGPGVAGGDDGAREGAAVRRTSSPPSERCGRAKWHPGLRDAALLVVAWLAVVVALTWPLAAHLSTRLPDTHPAARFDALLTAWAAAWESDALVSAPGRLFEANIYHPARNALLYVEAGFGALPIFAPVYLATRNPALALNATFLLGASLTAAALHLVVGGWVGSFGAGAIAAWCFLTTRWALWEFGPTAPNYVVLFWLPFILRLAARGPRPGRSSFALGVLVVVQSLVSVVYVAAATVLPLAVLAAARLARRATRGAGARLGVVLAAAILALSPIYLSLLSVRRDNPGLDRQTFWSVSQPTRVPLGPFAGFLSPLAAPWIVYALVLVGLLVHAGRGRHGPLREAWRHGALWFGVGLLASLARELQWGDRSFPGPLGWLAVFVPQAGILRVPSRAGIAGAMGLALLAGAAFAEIEGWLARRLRGRDDARRGAAALASALAVSMLAIYLRGGGTDSGLPERGRLPREYPTVPAIGGDSPLVALLRSSGRPVIELGTSDVPPANQYSGIVEIQARPMYRSIFHRAPILNGYGSFWPAGWFERMQFARRAPEPGVLSQLAAETGLAHVLLHVRGMPEDERKRWLSSPELRFVARDGDDLLFDVVPTPAARTREAPPGPVGSPQG